LEEYIEGKKNKHQNQPGFLLRGVTSVPSSKRKRISH